MSVQTPRAKGAESFMASDLSLTKDSGHEVAREAECTYVLPPTPSSHSHLDYPPSSTQTSILSPEDEHAANPSREDDKDDKDLHVLNAVSPLPSVIVGYSPCPLASRVGGVNPFYHNVENEAVR